MTGRPTFDDLVATMSRLRGPGGCPWDREQTHRSLEPYLLEETYETLEAIDAGSPPRLCQELGDLLLQVVFHAQMAAEAGTFTVQDVVAGLVEKLIRRHPHVFGDARVGGAQDVIANWDAIKAQERADGPHGSEREPARAAAASALDGLPRTLPALALAQRLQERAARAGLSWPDLSGAIANVREDLAEVEAAAKTQGATGGQHGAPAVERGRARRSEELGDLLFTIASLPRYLDLDGEQVLRDACATFRDRFSRVEATARRRGRDLREYTHDELVALWRAAR